MSSYSGFGKYAFVSYSHRNSGIVLEVINRLKSRGVHIWYDENLGPSDEYIEVIAEKVEKSDFFIAFLSVDSMNSRYCRDEIRFAYEANKSMMVIYLDDCELSAGYKMMLNGIQSFRIRNNVEKDTIDAIMGGIPRTVLDVIPGEKIYETDKYVYSFEDKSWGNGYKVYRIDKQNGSPEEIISEGFPPASDYRLNYVSRHYRGAPCFTINVWVRWDFTYTGYREDEYFEEVYEYTVFGINAERCQVAKNTLEHYDCNTGDNTIYDHVKGVDTISNYGKKTLKISGVDPLGNRWDYEKKEQ